ncbi:MAG: ferredoxin--NADP reductase domain-containing protein [Candidatus Binataceae bacterium]
MTDTSNNSSRHVIAVVGAATAGSEIARILARRGALVIVFEQNPRPYGKIEDGLPRWHVKQRLDEYRQINDRLDHPNIGYVPLTALGRDLDFDELRTAWGLSGIVLTHGAWRDRPFPVEGADQFIDRGLVYQNKLIYWFNHYEEKSYAGPRFDLTPGAIVVGGGLASIDVVKVLQIETVLRALAARGISGDLVRLEREGIEPVLAAHNLKWADIAVAPCKLYYRRRVLDMPLSDIAPDATPKRAEAMRSARAKILEKAMRKFLFEFQELRAPTGLIVENGAMAGVRFSATEVADGQVRIVTDSAEDPRAQLTISSIGSIPEPIPGIAQKGETYVYVDQKIGLLMDGPTAVFAAGNVLTGKGNIKDSLESGTEVGTRIAAAYLGLSDESFALAEGARHAAAAAGEAIAGAIDAREKLAPEAIDAILRRVEERQRAIGYAGNYRDWIAKVTPPDLE